MLSILNDWYPGDPALDFLLIVVLGVASCRPRRGPSRGRVTRKPASRHLVLFSALVCCLAMPALAAAFHRLGFTILAVPLLPPGPPRRTHPHR